MEPLPWVNKHIGGNVFFGNRVDGAISCDGVGYFLLLSRTVTFELRKLSGTCPMWLSERCWIGVTSSGLLATNSRSEMG